MYVVLGTGEQKEEEEDSLIVRGVPGKADDGSVPSVDEAAVNTPGHLQLTLHPDAA